MVRRFLEKLPFQQESDLVKTAYAICRWHHERWDGRGYPDGLKGEQIPIAAQVVSMADGVRRLDKRALLQKSVRPRHRGEDDPERGVRAVQPAAAGMPDRGAARSCMPS
ncbi:HD-GYP domain-containing protein [Gemmiger formicilis]|uniref:HD-GYP domain-containing protein n=1 Tax=Gemmiger formicilis TaxID=745368 RepID=UPI00351FB603